MSRPSRNWQERVITRSGAMDGKCWGVASRLVLQTEVKTRVAELEYELDREWLTNLCPRGYQQRQGTREYVLDPINSAASGSMLSLSNEAYRVIESYRLRRATIRHDE